jgi:hypothetical protein
MEESATLTVQGTLATCFVLYLCTATLLRTTESSLTALPAPFVVDYVRKLV